MAATIRSRTKLEKSLNWCIREEARLELATKKFKTTAKRKAVDVAADHASSPGTVQKKKTQLDARRRQIFWDRRETKPDSRRKKILPDGLGSVPEYKPRPTLQQRFIVVQWCMGKYAEWKSNMQASRASDKMNRRKRRSKQRLCKTGRAGAQRMRSGLNMQSAASSQFPDIVGSRRICRWIKQCKLESWSNIPEYYRSKMVELTNHWRILLGRPAKARCNRVESTFPIKLLEELDKLVAEFAVGTHEACDRNDVVLVQHVVLDLLS